MGNVVSLKSVASKNAQAMGARKRHKNAGQPLVYIVVLNYRKPSLTESCIESLQHLTYPNTRLVVIDNHSKDDSALRLLGFPGVYRFIQSPVNSGYSAGNNLGIRLALAEGADYVWILNNDTQVDPEALTQLVQAAEAQGPGVYGSVLRKIEAGGFLYAGGVLSPWQGRTRGLTEADVQNGLRPQYLSGASMLISSEVLQSIGPLEESYFLYAEDIEFCLRAQRAQFPVVSVLESRVFHHQGASSGGKDRPLNQYYGQRNRMKLFWAHGTQLQKASLLVCRGVDWVLWGAKALIHPSPERRKRYQKRFRIFQAALWDFLTGVRGASPHTF